MWGFEKKFQGDRVEKDVAAQAQYKFKVDVGVKTVEQRILARIRDEETPHL